MLCSQERESWSHLRQCSHLLSRLNALRQATKLGFEDLLFITVLNCSTVFTSAWNALTCWSLLSTNNTNYVTFDYLIQGIVPSSLLVLLMTVTSRKEATSLINDIRHTAQSLFKEEIWDYRCSHLAEWESSKGITSE